MGANKPPRPLRNIDDIVSALRNMSAEQRRGCAGEAPSERATAIDKAARAVFHLLPRCVPSLLSPHAAPNAERLMQMKELPPEPPPSWPLPAQLVPPFVRPPAANDAGDPLTGAPARDAGGFLYKKDESYTENFDRYLSLLPEVERMWLPKEERRAAHQTPAPKLLVNYHKLVEEYWAKHAGKPAGKHVGSDSHLLRIVYAVRNKSKPQRD